ncbi:D-alanyl-D-alanine carboxypeptidase/D-alanyl-D-alanine-endopeptidase [Ornithinimicrobium sp. W1679]|uniref:D-alanyl-D-alanine carboxypeptidase/D-alanyl-D-alanine-endopeptidase n=1 Tax=Ornithinimicrobium sp. W1679 TaxID=3418770 RepID=UPI003CEE9003
MSAFMLAAVLAGAPALAAPDAATSTTGPTPEAEPPSDAGAASTAGPTSSEADPAATTSAPEPTSPAQVRPVVAPTVRPLGQVADGSVPGPAGVEEALEDELDSRWLGPANRRAVTVRDALTGEHLLDRNADRLLTPASTTKILAAAAVVTGLDVEHTFPTRVVRGTGPQELVLVAGGDMLLARGAGDPDAVAGHAGLGDLADQVAEALQAEGSTAPVRLRVDLTHAAGPSVLDSWTDFWVAEGYTGRIVQLGLEEDRALPFFPSPRDPAQEAVRAFAAALLDRGVPLAGEGDAVLTEAEDLADLPDVPEVEVATGAGADTAPEDGGSTQEAGPADDAPASGDTAAGAPEELAVVRSAPLRDVLALALATSDNAMVEQLSRQAAVAAGRTPDRQDVTAWVEETLTRTYGVDLTGVEVADTSGLSDGTILPVRVVADLLVAGADGSHPDLQAVLAAGGLPIAGYTGTLATRFHLPVHGPAIGTARAKTGSLPGVTSLAGTVVTADGRLLVYALGADRIGEDGAVLEARSVLDEIVAELARCGCS